MALIESEGRLIQNLIHFSTTTTLVSGLLLAVLPLTVLAQSQQTPLDSIRPLPTAAKTLQEAGWTNQSITPTPAHLSQTSTPETPEESSSETTEPEIRYFTPRIGARFVSGPEVGYPSSVAGLEGFLPLIQTGEQNLTFLEGRFLLSTNEESNLRGNFIIGHRFYTDQRIYGAYLGYDIRDTEFNQFNQLGFGVETLGEVWDGHFNLYVPLGNTQQQIGENVTTVNTITQSVTADRTSFQKNFLVFQDVRLQQQKEQQITRFYENALFGLDFDIGAKILQIGNQGDLRGFVGGYYYDGQQIRDDIWGWRLGLEMKPTDTLRLGISVQDDDTFGTNVIVRLGANFPGTRPRNTSVEEVWARMGEWVHRQEQIVVDEVQTTQTIVFPVEVSSIPFIVAINPTTNQPWIFRHVNLGQGGGDGTFENPFGTVDGAISVAQNNDIVYVQSGTNPGIPSFRVPDGVQVLSTGPQQVIPTANRGDVILPLSNAGILPTVNGTITMGNNSVLSGFDINGTNSGVRAIGVNNFVIRDNIIKGTNGEAALLLTNASNGLITNNQIIGIGSPGLVASNVRNISLPNNTLTSSNSTSDGITLDQINDSIDFTGTTTTITNAKNRGIAVTNSNGNVNFPQATINQTTGGTAVEVIGGSPNVNITANINDIGGRLLRVASTTGGTVNLNGSLTNTNGTGILVENTSATVNVSEATINQATGGTAVEVIGGSPSVNVTGNLNNTGGKLLRLANTTGGTVSLNGSQTNTNGTGILVENASGTVNVSQATINQGTAVEVIGSSPLVNVTGNINDIGGRLLRVASTTGGTVNLNGSLTNTNGTGILVENTSATVNVSEATINQATGGTAVEVIGGSSSVNVTGNINNTGGRLLRVANTTGGTVNLNGSLTNTNGTGILVENASSTVNVSQATINQATGGTAVEVIGGSPSVNVTGNLNNTGGKLLRLANTTGGTVSLNGSQTNTNGTGILVENASGTVNVSQATINQGTAVEVIGSSPLVNVTGNINDIGGRLLRVASTTGGTVNLNGSLTNTNGTGILVENTSATVNVSQATINQATGGTAVEVIGDSPSVNVTGNLNNTGGRLLRVANTTGGTVNLNGSQTNTNGTGILVENASSTVNVSQATIDQATGGTAVEVDGGSSSVNVTGNINNTEGRLLRVANTTGGTVNLNGSQTNTNGTGILVENASSTVNVSQATINQATGGTAVEVDGGSSSVNVTGNINNTEGRLLRVANTTGGTVNLNGSQTNTNGTGILVKDASSTVNVSQATINQATGGTAVEVDGGSSSVDVTGNINNTEGRLLRVANTTGGTVNLNGSQTNTNGTGILVENASSTVNVSQATINQATGGTAVEVIGGSPSVNVTGNINNTGGKLLRVANTSGGIVNLNGSLINTNGTGILVETGSGTVNVDNASIQNAQNNAVEVNNFQGTVNLSNLNVANPGGRGIIAVGVPNGQTNVNVNNSTITNTENAAIESTNTNLTVNAVGISGSGGDGIKVSNDDGISHTVAINNTQINNGNAQGINIDNATITAFANNQINNVTGNGINLAQTTFDADPNTPGFQAVSGGTTTVDRAVGNGIQLNNVSGTLTPDTTWKISNIRNNNLPGNINSGLYAEGNINLIIGNIDINNITNPNQSSIGINLNKLTGSFTVAGNTAIGLTGSVGTGITIQNSNGTYSFSNGKTVTITNTTSDGILISGGSHNATFSDTNISNAGGNGVTISGVGTGSTTFNNLNIMTVKSGVSFTTGNTYHLIINGGSIQNTTSTNTSNGNGIDSQSVINLTVSNVEFNNIARSAISNNNGFPAVNSEQRTITLTNNTFRGNSANVIDLTARDLEPDNANLCLRFTGNTISTGTSNNNNGTIRFRKIGVQGTFQVENLAPPITFTTFRNLNSNWTGALNTSGTITNVSTGTCPNP